MTDTAWLEATIENALSDADFGKNNGGFDNGRPRKNVQRFIEALARRGLHIEARATPAEALDVERLRRAIFMHLRNYGDRPHKCNELCAPELTDEYARLSSGAEDTP